MVNTKFYGHYMHRHVSYYIDKWPTFPPVFLWDHLIPHDRWLLPPPGIPLGPPDPLHSCPGENWVALPQYTLSCGLQHTSPHLSVLYSGCLNQSISQSVKASKLLEACWCWISLLTVGEKQTDCISLSGVMEVEEDDRRSLSGLSK